MKRYIAICGNSNSGIQTKEKALAWASTQMTQKQNLDLVHIAKVTEVVQRTVPVTELHPFVPEREELKTA